MVGAAFAGIVFSLRLAVGAVKDCPHRLLAKGVAGGDVDKLLSGSWTLLP
jgi:hypothetical protein